MIYITPNAFMNATPRTALDHLMRAASDHETRQQVYQAEYKRATEELKLSPTLAAMHAAHASSPYSLGLKWKGTALPVDAERMLEDLVIQTTLRKRNAVSDLIAAGKVRSLPDIGVLTDVWKRVSDQGAAEIAMNLAGGPTFQRQTFDTAGVPIPVIQSRFQFEARELLAAARSGSPLDTLHVIRAAEKVAEAEEDMLINGNTNVVVNGLNIYGYRTHPQRITVTGSDFGTVANVFSTFNSAMDAARQANVDGEYVFYVAPTQYGQMIPDHKADSDKTALQRALEIPGIRAIKYNAFVPDGQAVGVNMTSPDVDLAIAQNVTSVPWESEGGALQSWRVFSAMAPRLKADQANQLGVIHISSI